MNRLKSVATKSQPRMLQVKRVHRISDHMQRITLSGAELEGFPRDRNGAHIKLFIPREEQTFPVLPSRGPRGIEWPPGAAKPITRTYSVRRYCVQSNELDIDFVLHGRNCPASGWARRARPGDYLGVAGPGGPCPLLAPADWHLIAGDLTALPAISALLEELPAASRGYALIEVDSVADIQVLKRAGPLLIRWSVRHQDIPLLEQVRKIVQDNRNEQSVSAFVAGENHLVTSLRDVLREAYGLNKQQLYAVPYWCRGKNEEAYHQQRHRIMDLVY